MSDDPYFSLEDQPRRAAAQPPTAPQPDGLAAQPNLPAAKPDSFFGNTPASTGPEYSYGSAPDYSAPGGTTPPSGYGTPGTGYSAPTSGYAQGYGPGSAGYAPGQAPYGQVPPSGGYGPGYQQPGYGPGYPPPGYGAYPPATVGYGFARPVVNDPFGIDAPKPNASLVEAYKRFWTRSLTFTGRASRSEYWMAALAHVLVTGGISLVGLAFPPLFLLIVIYMLAAIVPSISLGIRRLHDSNNSGAMMLINLIPYVGAFAVLIFMLQDSKPEGARFDAINH